MDNDLSNKANVERRNYMDTGKVFYRGTDEALVEAVYLQGDGLMLTRINGPAWCESEFEDAIQDAYQVENLRDGIYVFEMSFNAGQVDEVGRCELLPCWEADLLKFEEIPDAD